MDILNTHKPTDDIASSGQPLRDQFEAIAAGGYVAVINLAMPSSENFLTDEGGIVSALGMSYFHIPVPWEKPEEWHYQLFRSVMNALQGRKVWVHCALNLRVSAFLYRYLQQEQGFAEAEAISPPMRQWLPGMEPAWQQFISAPE